MERRRYESGLRRMNSADAAFEMQHKTINIECTSVFKRSATPYPCSDFRGATPVERPSWSDPRGAARVEHATTGLDNDGDGKEEDEVFGACNRIINSSQMTAACLCVFHRCPFMIEKHRVVFPTVVARSADDVKTRRMEKGNLDIILRQQYYYTANIQQ